VNKLFSKFGVGAILTALLSQATAMFQAELEVAKEEFTKKLKGLAAGTGLVAFAISLFSVSITLLIIAGVAGLTTIWPLWQAALVVGGGVLVLALIFMAIGAVKIKNNRDLRPERAVSAYNAASKYFD